MWLPYPTPEGVEKFKELVKQEYGLELSPTEAQTSAVRMLHLLFIKKYGLPYLEGAGEGRIETVLPRARRKYKKRRPSRPS